MIQMKCPICNKIVEKVKEADKPIKNHVICENEYYIHYTNKNDEHILIKFSEIKTDEIEHQAIV